MTATRGETIERQYDRLRLQAREAKLRGDLQGALALYDRALEVAREIGEPARVDVAFCNRSVMAIALGDYHEPRSPLRKVLMRRSSATAAFLAADCLARAHELTKEFKKGLFYARTARHHAAAAGNPEWLASSHNLSGNCLLGESHFEEAADDYRQALALVEETGSERFCAGLRLNLGYCLGMLGDLDQAFTMAFSSLRVFRAFDAPADQAWAHLDLCQAYIELGRAHRARRHGLRALARATVCGERDLRRNALFLLGETERLAGDLDTAYAYFHQLQEFYPETPNVAETMLCYDMRKLVNLRA